MTPCTLYYNLTSTIGLSVRDRTLEHQRCMTYNQRLEITDATSLERIVRFHDVHNISFKDGVPSAVSFIETNILSIDVDDGKSIESFLKENEQLCFYLYTSKSHTEESHRYHVLFPLSFSIKSLEEYKKYYTVLRRLYPFFCKGMRLTNCLFGNPDAKLSWNEGASIAAVLQPIMMDIRKEDTARKCANGTASESIAGVELNLILPRKGARFYRLGVKAERILHGKASEYPYKSRSEAEAAVVMTCVKNGWSYEQIEELFKTEAVANTHFRDEGKNCYKWLRQTHRAMLGYYKRDKGIAALESFLQGIDFQGGSRYTDMEVSKVVLQMMKETGKMEGLSITLAEVSQLAGIGISTAGKSLKRLCEVWLTREQRGREEISYSVKRAILESLTREALLTPERKPEINNHGLDLFNKAGLGKTGKLIFEYLSQYHASTIPQIQKQTGIGSYNTVKSKLLKMERIGMVQKLGKRWKLILNKLDQKSEAILSGKLHVSGIVETRNREYIRQRENWKQEKARFRERKILEAKWKEEQKVKDISAFVEVGGLAEDQQSA